MDSYINDQDVDSSTFKKLEAMLYKHAMAGEAIKNLEAQLEEMKLDYTLSYSKSVSQVASSQLEKFSKTEEAALDGLESNRAKWLMQDIESKKRIHRAVTQALQLLTDEERQLIELKYFKRRTSWQIWEELIISDSTFYRRRGSTVKKMAYILGLI